MLADVMQQVKVMDKNGPLGRSLFGDKENAHTHEENDPNNDVESSDRDSESDDEEGSGDDGDPHDDADPHKDKEDSANEPRVRKRPGMSQQVMKMVM